MYRMPLGGALLNGGPQQARRVVSASAALVCAAGVTVGAWVDRAGQAEAASTLSAAPSAVADRAGQVEADVRLQVEPPWPRDLVTATASGKATADPFGHAIRAGNGQADVRAELEASSIIYAFYAEAKLSATVTADALRTAYLWAEPHGSSDVSAYGWRLKDTRAAATAAITATVDGDKYSGGIVTIQGRGRLQAAPRVNGVQGDQPRARGTVHAAAEPTRLADGRARAPGWWMVEVEAKPGRGAEVETVHARMTMTASWWRYTYQNATARVRAEVHPQAHAIRDAEAEASPRLLVEAPWALWQEIKRVPFRLRASVTAPPERIMSLPEQRARGGWALSAYAWRVIHSESGAEPELTATARPSINLTNDAPPHRSMTVPEPPRALSVPRERRVMRVRA